MADSPDIENGLPPKLDLKKIGIAPMADRTPVAFPGSTNSETASKKPSVPPSPAGTMRINIPEEYKDVAERPTLRARPVLTPIGTPTTAVPTPTAPAQGPTPIKAITPLQPAIPSRPMPPSNAAENAAAPTTPSIAAPAISGQPVRPMIRPIMAPKTIKLKPPVPIGIKRETADITALTGSKRETSKIPLPADLSSITAQVPAGIKSIKISPISAGMNAPTSLKAAEPSDNGTEASGIPAAPAATPDPKRQTSRISLESVLGAESSSGPKTIKLKRPVQSSTIKIQGIEQPSSIDGIQKTSQIDAAAVEDSGDKQDTQKKTIRVKRPSIKTSARASIQAESGDASVMFTAPTARVAPVDTVHWTFITSAFAALIICFVLIYVMTAQVIGPNLSLTQLSYGAPDTELPWPGRIPRK